MAEKGHRVYIASMPLNLAIFGQNKADSFISEHQDRRYVIGGHSLGGVFAARYASEHADVIDGVYFMASYADDGGKLNGLNMSALQITGTQDGVLDRTEWELQERICRTIRHTWILRAAITDNSVLTVSKRETTKLP